VIIGTGVIIGVHTSRNVCRSARINLISFSIYSTYVFSVKVDKHCRAFLKFCSISIGKYCNIPYLLKSFCKSANEQGGALNRPADVLIYSTQPHLMILFIFRSSPSFIDLYMFSKYLCSLKRRSEQLLRWSMILCHVVFYMSDKGV